MRLPLRPRLFRITDIIASLAVAALLYYAGFTGLKKTIALPEPHHTAGQITLNDTQRKVITIATATERLFIATRESTGSIDFDEDKTIPVFPPYQGEIIGAFVATGDEVKKGQLLFTVASPDLIQAESALIAAAATMDMATKVLIRDRDLYKTQGIARKELDQAVSDQQTAQGALEAERNAVQIFGKTSAQIDRIISKREIDPALAVTSPVSGCVTARNAAPGLFVQPGVAPAPYSVTNNSSMWMVANVTESDSPLLHTGQKVRVRVAAYPNRVFEGRIGVVGASVDPVTRRVMVRSEIPDPTHMLKAGMYATFMIDTGSPAESVSIPLGSVVREGDGTMMVWTTDDNRHFEKRTVKVGIEQDGYDQILDGLKPEELVVTNGALFMDNALGMTEQ